MITQINSTVDFTGIFIIKGDRPDVDTAHNLIHKEYNKQNKTFYDLDSLYLVNKDWYKQGDVVELYEATNNNTDSIKIFRSQQNKYSLEKHKYKYENNSLKAFPNIDTDVLKANKLENDLITKIYEQSSKKYKINTPDYKRFLAEFNKIQEQHTSALKSALLRFTSGNSKVNILSAKEVINAINNNCFDFVNGIIKIRK